jgi:hypothetical protein
MALPLLPGGAVVGDPQAIVQVIGPGSGFQPPDQFNPSTQLELRPGCAWIGKIDSTLGSVLPTGGVIFPYNVVTSIVTAFSRFTSEAKLLRFADYILSPQTINAVILDTSGFALSLPEKMSLPSLLLAIVQSGHRNDIGVNDFVAVETAVYPAQPQARLRLSAFRMSALTLGNILCNDEIGTRLFHASLEAALGWRGHVIDRQIESAFSRGFLQLYSKLLAKHIDAMPTLLHVETMQSLQQLALPDALIQGFSTILELSESLDFMINYKANPKVAFPHRLPRALLSYPLVLSLVGRAADLQGATCRIIDATTGLPETLTLDSLEAAESCLRESQGEYPQSDITAIAAFFKTRRLAIDHAVKAASSDGTVYSHAAIAAAASKKTLYLVSAEYTSALEQLQAAAPLDRLPVALTTTCKTIQAAVRQGIASAGDEGAVLAAESTKLFPQYLNKCVLQSSRQFGIEDRLRMGGFKISDDEANALLVFDFKKGNVFNVITRYFEMVNMAKIGNSSIFAMPNGLETLLNVLLDAILPAMGTPQQPIAAMRGALATMATALVASPHKAHLMNQSLTLMLQDIEGQSVHYLSKGVPSTTPFVLKLLPENAGLQQVVQMVSAQTTALTIQYSQHLLTGGGANGSMPASSSPDFAGYDLSSFAASSTFVATSSALEGAPFGKRLRVDLEETSPVGPPGSCLNRVNINGNVLTLGSTSKVRFNIGKFRRDASKYEPELPVDIPQSFFVRGTIANKKRYCPVGTPDKYFVTPKPWFNSDSYRMTDFA